MPKTAPPEPVFFATPEALRAWLAAHHAEAQELWVGYYKKGTGRPSVTWPESVDAALCYGWIDGVRQSLDADRYCIRFTPRRPGSTWSRINIGRVEALSALGLMQPAGLAAFAARRADKSGVYAYEQRRAELAEPYVRLLKKNKAAWTFFQAQPASYRQTVGWWIASAKQAATRLRRLEKLAACSAEGRRLPEFTPRKARRAA